MGEHTAVAYNSWCCVYLVDSAGFENLDGCTPEYAQYHANRPQFCDLGDDPAFFSASHNDAEVTWGVCRHNVRQSLHIGDEVFFVCCDKTNFRRWQYYLIGFGLVERLISHSDIYTDNANLSFQNYFNLLLHHGEAGFEHIESPPPLYWHEDWLMRISAFRTKKELEKRTRFSGCRAKGIPKKDLPSVANVVPANFPIGKNYVVFSKQESRFCHENPVYLAEVVWVKHRHPQIRWDRDETQTLFCNKSKTTRNFTHGGYQHPAFHLQPRNVAAIKDLLPL